MPLLTVGKNKTMFSQWFHLNIEFFDHEQYSMELCDITDQAIWIQFTFLTQYILRQFACMG